LLLCSDLVTSSQVSGAAALQGMACETTVDVDSLAERAAAGTVQLVILDLGMPRLDLAMAVARARQLGPAVKVLAFGPHVHEGLLERARAVGCDQVMSRGQFHARLVDILRALGDPA